MLIGMTKKRIRLKKYVTLAQETIQHIETYADANKIHFSRAIEQLALTGLADTKSQGQADMTAMAVEQAIQRSLRRLTRLLIHTAVEAGSAKQMANQIFFTQLLELERANSAETVKTLLEVDPTSDEGGLLIDLYRQRMTRNHQRAVVSARSSLKSLKELLTDLIEAEEPDDDR